MPFLHQTPNRPLIAPSPIGRGRLFLRGLTRRCPVCGSGGLFRRWFQMVATCPRCGFHFERESGHWVGSLGMNTIVSFGAVLATIVAGVVVTAPDIAVGPITAAGAAVAVLTPVVIFPFTRTLWAAVDLMMRPLEPGELQPAVARDGDPHDAERP